MAKWTLLVLIWMLCQNFCEGFDFTFDPYIPNPTDGVKGRQICGVLHCGETLLDSSRGQTNRSRSLTNLTISRVRLNGATVSIEQWQQIASVSPLEPTLNRVSDGVKATGQLTGQQASLSLELTKTNDCQESQFSCVAVNVDDLGRTSVKKSLVGKAVGHDISSPNDLNQAASVSVPVSQSRNVFAADNQASQPGALVQLVSSIQMKVDLIGSRVEDSLRAMENRLEDKTGGLDKSMESRFGTLDTRLNSLENRLEDKVTQLQNSMVQHLRQTGSPISDKAHSCNELALKLDDLGSKLDSNTGKLDTFVTGVKKQNESTGNVLDQLETAIGQCTRNQDTDLNDLVPGLNSLPELTQDLISKVSSFRDGYGGGALLPVDEFFDPLNSGKKEWRLAFRGTAFNNVQVYPAYLYGTGIPVEVEKGCKQFNFSLPCTNHYRNRDAFENWARVDEVLFAIYKDGEMVKRVVFNGKRSTFTSWFAEDRIVMSSWIDLTTQPHNFFSIAGAVHNGCSRQFFMNLDYAQGCDGFRGWFKSTDIKGCCPVEVASSAIPMFKYAPGDTFAVWQSTAAIADAFGIFLKYE